EIRPEFASYVLVAMLVKPAVFMLLGMCRRYWRYASVQELAVVVMGVTASSASMALLVILASATGVLPSGFSRVVLFSDWLFTMAGAGGLRLAIRIAHDSKQSLTRNRTGASRRILIVGAGAAGTMVAKEMRRNPQLGMIPVGFLDDDPGKIGKHIAGLQ